MEGYKDIYWSGDRIVWQNLFRHYLLCFLLATTVRSVAGEIQPAELKTFVLNTPDTLPDAPVREIYRRICEQFLAEIKVQNLIESLGDHRSVRREELMHHLCIFHGLAIKLLVTELGAQVQNGQINT
jgi:hypothetical protein